LRISRKINDKIMPQKLEGATYRRVYTSTPPRFLTAAISYRHQYIRSVTTGNRSIIFVGKVI